MTPEQPTERMTAERRKHHEHIADMSRRGYAMGSTEIYDAISESLHELAAVEAELKQSLRVGLRRMAERDLYEHQRDAAIAEQNALRNPAAWVGKCKKCGAVRAFVRHEPDYIDDTTNALREFLEGGLMIEPSTYPITMGEHTCGEVRNV